MVASLRYEHKHLMEVVLQMQNTQNEMMQMLREVKQEIFRIKENNADYDGYASNLDEIMVSISLIATES